MLYRAYSGAEPAEAAQHQELICWVSPGVLKVYLHGLEGEVWAAVALGQISVV